MSASAFHPKMEYYHVPHLVIGCRRLFGNGCSHPQPRIKSDWNANYSTPLSESLDLSFDCGMYGCVDSHESLSIERECGGLPQFSQPDRPIGLQQSNTIH